jgi:hypothetical protein
MEKLISITLNLLLYKKKALQKKGGAGEEYTEIQTYKLSVRVFGVVK